MRAVMSGTSVNARPRRNASKNRGGSKISSRTSSTWLSRRRTWRDPSPSTRASGPERSSRSAMCLAELRRARVEGAEQPHDVDLLQPEVVAERARVRRLHRPEAAEAAAVIARAQRPAARVRDGPEAGRAVGDHHADVAGPLALDADAVVADRGPSLVQERADDLEQLALVGRTAL